ncbi:MAG TPA: arabinofuranosidase catalytic domain-containing protein [Polyangiaceae bacterium]|nr:arabinofuranosidase catalytic domain-containing protein [Polyangiaceae bacterium]
MSRRLRAIVYLGVQRAAVLSLVCTAFACSTSSSDAAPHGDSDAGSSSVSSSGGGSSSSSGSTSASGGSSSGASSVSGAAAGGSAGASGNTSAGASGSAGSEAAAGSGGGPARTVVQGPCDIYQSGNTPCVAAHSTVRALYGSYSGKLYQVQRVADNATKDIYPLGPGGYADSASQDTFCAQTNCTISIIYDQSPQHNDLPASPPSTFLPTGGTAAIANAQKITMAGSHSVYGVYVAGGGTAYRNDNTTGVAKGNQPEAMYMVLDATRFSGTCCFDYGNAEANGQDDGNGTMEAIYWGSDTFWGGQGQGNGPWIAADLENGMFKCDDGFPQTNLVLSQACPTALAQTITAKLATAMLKGPADNTFTLKSADAQSGTLVVQWDGPRPSPSGYYPKNLQGAIILGTGGDGSDGGKGTFFEGAMTAGNPSDDIDNLVQANIVAAGYGQ